MFILVSCNKVPGTGKPELTNELDSVSYALGIIIANDIIRQLEQSKNIFDTIDNKMIARAFVGAEVQDKWLEYISSRLDTINDNIFRKGFLNQLSYGKNGVFNDMMAEGVLSKKTREIKERKDKELKELADNNLEMGKKFLSENKLKEGVVETESGLQYEVLVEGTGMSPEEGDRIKCIYHGTMLNGVVFDSSRERGDTAMFNVGGVIQGWKEALPMMKEGSKWKLYVPSNLGYGERGNVKVEPNATLIFEMELIEVISKK
ncbi:MAG: FKBP-type peptidyl-prolyl cis-trans isomerase [Marinilabiliaceae bacterium]|nr:FKBP-type peptidyl-prolyl cis-trans isomerase [Marinilabiliaceae bacterium]